MITRLFLFVLLRLRLIRVASRIRCLRNSVQHAYLSPGSRSALSEKRICLGHICYALWQEIQLFNPKEGGELFTGAISLRSSPPHHAVQ